MTEKPSFFSESFIIAVAVLTTMALVGYNSFLYPDFLPPRAKPVEYSQAAYSAEQAEVSSKAASVEEAVEAAGPVKDPDALVNVNTATVEDLQTVTGIGPVMAKRILEYRDQVGVIQNIGELINVSGIGETTLFKIAPHLTVY